MMRRNDPRIRQRWNQLSSNLESANENAQANIFTFVQNYVNPCFSSIGGCLDSCTSVCFPSHEERMRRQRRATRGRAELNFDFYDDWDDDDYGADDGLLGWGNDELDRLLAGSGSHAAGSERQPGRKRAMSYGARRGREGAGKRKSAVQPHDGGPDPTIIPNSSVFGFLGRLPWKIGGKGLRYQPSAASLEEHPGARHSFDEAEPLIEESPEEQDNASLRRHKRARSGTQGSESTIDSMRSRGDLFPSEDEDDAVPLDDEFALVLERRTTKSLPDDTSSGKTRSGRRPTVSRNSTRADSLRGAANQSRNRGASMTKSSSTTSLARDDADPVDVPTEDEIKREEEQVQREEENAIERKREEAQKLARERGLSSAAASMSSGGTANWPQLPNINAEARDISKRQDLQTSANDAFRSTDAIADEEFVPARLPNFHGES